MGSFNNLKKKPCSAVMKKIGYLTQEESKKQCYLLDQQSIRYDHAWLTSKDKNILSDGKPCKPSALEAKVLEEMLYQQKSIT